MSRSHACLRPMFCILNLSFALVTVLIWMTELFDIPCRIGLGPKTPINLAESVIESIAVITVWIMTMVWFRKASARLHILEGILPICSYCKKIRDKNNDWQSVDSYVTDHSEAQFSHSVCPDCLRREYPEMVDEILTDSTRPSEER